MPDLRQVVTYLSSDFSPAALRSRWVYCTAQLCVHLSHRGTCTSMNSAVTVTQKQLGDFLLNVALARPVFIWGPPGIGKSSLVQQFAAQVGLPCVSLLGSQHAPEDLIGVPQILDGTSRL